MAQQKKQSDSVYDNDRSEKAVTRPDLRDLEGINSNTAGGSSDSGNRFAGSSTSAGSSGASNSTSSTPNRLKQDEESAGEDDDDENKVGKGYARDRSNSTGGNKTKVRFTRKRALVGGAAVGGVISLVVASSSFLAPLKIEHIVSNLQNRFFASSEQAVGDESDHMFRNYVRNHVIKDYKNCSSTISKKCQVRIVGGPNNPVKNLYRAWADAKLENKLATNYGIEFRHNPGNNTWYLKAPGTSTKGDNIGTNGSGLDAEFERSDRAAMRTALKQGMEGETRWKKVTYRFKVGRLLEAKYGIRRCIIFCGTKDALADKKDDKKNAAKLFLVKRVIIPRTQNLGIVMQCLAEGCNDFSDPKPTDGSDNNAAMNGAPETEMDKQLRDNLGSLATGYGAEEADKLVSDYKTVSEKGYTAYAVKSVLDKIGLDAISKNVSDKVPVVGWITSGAHIVNGLNNAGPTLKVATYSLNSAAAAQIYMMFRTYSDEGHTGNVDATEFGSMVGSLGPGDHGESTDPIVGGTASAEATPLYHNLISDGSTSSNTALLNSFWPSSAYAASSSGASETSASKDYKCADGKTVPSGKLVCSEEKLSYDSAALNTVHEVLNTPPFSVLTAAAGVIGDLSSGINKLLGWALEPLMKASGLNNLASAVSDVIGPAFEGLVKKIIPSPVSSNMSGGRTFDMAAAGADVSGNDYAHTGLGGQKLTATQSATILNKQNSEDQIAFEQKPLFARMFSTESRYSLVSKMAMSVPFDVRGSVQRSFASLISNPFGVLGHGFASAVSTQASAAPNTPQDDPFGVVQYGYPDGVPENPEAYWDQHCSDNAAHAYQNDADYAASDWNKAAAENIDDNTGTPVNANTNPCLLIKATTGVVGAIYDKDLLTQDDLVGQGSSATGGSLPNGSAKDLATQLVPVIASGKITCNFQGANCPDIQKTATGASIKGGQGCQVDALDPALLGMLLELTKMGHKFILSALCSDHHDDGGATAGHSGGKAADFNSIDGTSMGPDAGAQWTGKKLQVGKKLDQDAASFMPKSTGFGQKSCHETFSFLSGFNYFDDTCHHQHIQVK